MYRPPNITTYREWDFDNFKFIVHELFLYAGACFLRYERFQAIAYLMRHQYYVEQSENPLKMVHFGDIREHMRSLEHRNSRLKLRRSSLRSEFLHKRWRSTGMKDSLLMQTDFILYVRDCLDSLRGKEYQTWWPDTLLYVDRHSRVFEIFGRSQSKEYFDQIKCMFDIDNKADFDPLFQAFREQKLRIPSWDWTTFNPVVLMGYENLATKP